MLDDSKQKMNFICPFMRIMEKNRIQVEARKFLTEAI